jgi:ATP-dependent DNA helicase RecG
MIALNATTEDIREMKVREFAKEIKSGLINISDTRQLYRSLMLTVPINGYDAPKNAALLMFSRDPREWFRGRHLEIVYFPNGPGGDDIIENNCTGGLHEQIWSALRILRTYSKHCIRKQEHDFKALHWDDYPEAAYREALVNAYCHSSYEPSNVEPIKVYIYPERMVIASYPGPVPGIELKHLRLEASMPTVQYRNRRIGEFLKELKLAEGHLTGVQKIYDAMRANGSPDPIFWFNEERTFFEVTLPIHP